MNIEALAADIASRVPEMAKDSPINNAELIKKLIESECYRSVALAVKRLREIQEYNAIASRGF